MMQRVVILLLVVCLTVSSFQRAPIAKGIRSRQPLSLSASSLDEQAEIVDVMSKDSMVSSSSLSLSSLSDVESLLSPAVLGSLALLLLPTDPAMAANQYGIFAGKTASFIHPITMAALFGTSLYAGYLGLKFRRMRDLSGEIKELQKQGPILSSGPAKFPLSSAREDINAQIAGMSAETNADQIAVLKRDLTTLQGASALETQIAELTSERKTLQGAKLRDKHETTGSWLLGAGTTVALLGAFNTYMRAGKLFPGPHLFAGMAVTISWAVAASLTPAMAKGNEAARSAHIAINSVGVVLFAWQVLSGVEIALKVWEKAPWP